MEPSPRVSLIYWNYVEPPLRYWHDMYFAQHFPKSLPSTDNNDASHLQSQYAKSMPHITHPPYHNTFVLEAQPPAPRQPFSETLLGRFPPEIREKIYIAALRIEPTPGKNGLALHYATRQKPPLPEYIKDHQPVRAHFDERRWPKEEQQESAALVATFPPRANPRGKSRLALLSCCRQVYEEAWYLYYSTNMFEFHDLSAFIQFWKDIGARRGRELTSIAFTRMDSECEETLLIEAVGYLNGCRHLRYLELGLYWNWVQWDRLLEKLRGMERISVVMRDWRLDRRRDLRLRGDREADAEEVEGARRWLLTRGVGETCSSGG